MAGIKEDLSDGPILLKPEIIVLPADLEKNIRVGKSGSKILETAKETLCRVQEYWTPAALVRWYPFKTCDTSGTGWIIPDTGDPVKLNFGESFQFIRQAEYVMVALYTVGDKFDDLSKQAASQGHVLTSYLIDLIGLIALDKVCDAVKQTAEKTARERGWGVSPYLSPGSLPGWNLSEQSKLCTLLPMETIHVSINANAVLSPLKSACVFIGMGPVLSRATVGSPCELCSNRGKCSHNMNIRKP